VKTLADLEIIWICIGFFPYNHYPRANLSPSTLLDAKVRILKVISEQGDAYGYALAERLGLDTATVYEHLRTLEKRGFVVSAKVVRRRVYRLTKKGQLLLEVLGH